MQRDGPKGQNNNYSQFDIHPGMTIWVDQPKEYKEQYYRNKKILQDADLKNWRKSKKESPPPEILPIDYGKDMNYLDKIRYFDPLKYPSILETNIVLHIPIQLNNRGSEGYKRQSDLDHLKWNLDNFRNQESIFKGELIISVNGFIDDNDIQKDACKWLEQNVNDKIIGAWHITVFQRPNYGYQWGGFYDVWSRYKQIRCPYFATLECDCFLQNNWYEECENRFKGNPALGFVGMAPDQDLKKAIRDQYNFSNRLWVNHAGLRHSRGGFYFCKRELLEKMDEKYGHFTLSIGHDQAIDGIACGEIGFSSKTRHLGFDYSTLQPKWVSVQLGKK